MSFHFHSLFFSPTPATLAVGILALIAVGALGVAAVRRSVHRKRTAALEALRFGITLVVVLLLWKPEWLVIHEPESRPQIAVLKDGSGSMETLDAELPERLSPGRGVVSRKEWVETVLEGELRASLTTDGLNELVEREVGTPPADEEATAGTDLTTPLVELLEERSNLRAAILLSDGDWNQGQPPVVAAQRFLQRGVPLFTIPTGSPTRLPDIEILAVNAPTYGIVGENVQIPFSIRSSLDRELRTTVRIRDESGLQRTKEIVIPPDRVTYESILWKITREGTTTLELSLPVAEGERVDSNNAIGFNLAGRPESIRVLVIESRPRWEYRYLRNALSRDPGVELSCLLFHPSLGTGGGPDYIDAFPSGREELAKYDVVFIGDVGVTPDQLTADQCELIKGLVENQASGVVFLPGRSGNQLGLLDTPLGELLPVQMDRDQPEGIVDSVASPLELTGEGRRSLLTLLADTEEENPQVWRSLPGFYWHAAVKRARAGTEVLAVHGNRRTDFGPTPVIVTRIAGNGKVLFMGIDSAWRWRRGVEDKYHYRFWGQVARWMSYQRNMAAGSNVRLYFTPERPKPGDVVAIQANAFDPNGAPLEDGTVVVDCTAPDGSTRRLNLEKDDSSWGAFSGQLKVDQSGEWTLRAGVMEDPREPVETTLLAQGVELEKQGQPVRTAVLGEMARVARGRMIQPSQLAELIREIRALPEPRPIESRIPLWSHWLTITVVIALLSVFWIGRKLNGTF